MDYVNIAKIRQLYATTIIGTVTIKLYREYDKHRNNQ